MAHDVFVSYSSKDKTVADSIVAAMENNGIRCWYAPRDIQPGDDWAEAITNAIDACQVFLMIFSENANQSQRVLDELNYAVSQEVVILPFRIENLIPRRAMMLHLSSRHWLDAYDPSWESHIKKLVQTVSVNLDKTLADEEIEVPAQVEQRKVQQKKTPAWMIAIWVIVGMAAVVGAWFGLSKILQGGQNPETTKEAQASEPTENIASQEVTATEDSSSCKIFFFSTREGESNIYTMGLDGSDQTQITFNQEVDNRPDISPDGSQITFMSARDGDNEIFVMNIGGTNIQKLTDNESDDERPRWSPDGTQIGFFSDRGGGYDLYVMNADGSDQKKITDLNFPDYSGSPRLSWSSDGSMIAFSCTMDGDSEIFLMNSDGSNFTQLTDNDNFDGQPDISPDMSQILFESDRYGDWEIFIMDITGGNIRQLTSSSGLSGAPDFSPKGTKIIFLSDRDYTQGEFILENIEVYMMNVDGSGVERLTDNQYFDDAPTFSPNCDF